MKQIVVLACGRYLLFCWNGEFIKIATAVVIATFGAAWAAVMRRSSPRDFAAWTEFASATLRAIAWPRRGVEFLSSASVNMKMSMGLVMTSGVLRSLASVVHEAIRVLGHRSNSRTRLVR